MCLGGHTAGSNLNANHVNQSLLRLNWKEPGEAGLSRSKSPDRTHERKMANLREVVSTYQVLTAEWNKKPPNLNKCGELLTNLKV